MLGEVFSTPGTCGNRINFVGLFGHVLDTETERDNGRLRRDFFAILRAVFMQHRIHGIGSGSALRVDALIIVGEAFVENDLVGGIFAHLGRRRRLRPRFTCKKSTLSGQVVHRE